MDNDKFLGHTSSIGDMRTHTIIHPAISTDLQSETVLLQILVGPAYSTSLENVNVIA
jgi:hypothetical protein